MAVLKNKYARIYDLNTVYIVDKEDDNALRTMLSEAIINKVIISSNGSIKMIAKVANQSEPSDLESLTFFSSVNDYKLASLPEPKHYLITQILDMLGVPSDSYTVTEDDNTVDAYGYIINSSNMVEKCTFPDNWEFTRDITISGQNCTLGTWEHNANFYDADVYPSIEEALANHKIQLLTMSGKIETV